MTRGAAGPGRAGQRYGGGGRAARPPSCPRLPPSRPCEHENAPRQQRRGAPAHRRVTPSAGGWSGARNNDKRHCPDRRAPDPAGIHSRTTPDNHHPERANGTRLRRRSHRGPRRPPHRTKGGTDRTTPQDQCRASAHCAAERKVTHPAGVQRGDRQRRQEPSHDRGLTGHALAPPAGLWVGGPVVFNDSGRGPGPQWAPTPPSRVRLLGDPPDHARARQSFFGAGGRTSYAGGWGTETSGRMPVRLRRKMIRSDFSPSVSPRGRSAESTPGPPNAAPSL